MKAEGRASVFGAAAVAGIQLAAALGVAILWHFTADNWGKAAYWSYFLAFPVLVPLVAFVVGRQLAARQELSLMRAWPIGVANVVALVAAHGLEDAGVGIAGTLAVFAGLSFLAGWVALRRTEHA